MNAKRVLPALLFVILIGGVIAIIILKGDNRIDAKATPLAHEAEQKKETLTDGVELWDADAVEAEIRANVADLPPLEAAQHLYNNAVPPYYDLFFEKVNQVIQENPDSVQAVEALILSGKARLGMGEYYLGREDFARAVKIDPQSGEAHLGLGKALYALDKYDDAIIEGKKAIELGYDEANTLLGYSYMHKGEWKDSLKHFQKTLEYVPNSTGFSFLRVCIRRSIKIG